MGIYEIKGTKSSPTVIFDINNNLLTIKGRSFNTNPGILYGEININLSLYSNLELLHITIDLTHCNTVSSKNLLELLKNAKGKFRNLEIIWIYDEDDTDLLDNGQTFYEILDVPFEFKSI